jgi:hypothetical protein
MNVETTQHKPCMLGGRPPKHPWNEIRPEIETLIAQGWGIGRLATRYGLTFKGMKEALVRLGLRTLGQPNREDA